MVIVRVLCVDYKSVAVIFINWKIIPFQNNLLDRDLCKNVFYFHIFSFVF